MKQLFVIASETYAMHERDAFPNITCCLLVFCFAERIVCGAADVLF